MDQHIRSAARAIARARKLVVFTGAGVSKESGIATFREPETGLWARYDPMELATCEAYVRRPPPRPTRGIRRSLSWSAYSPRSAW